MIEESLSQEASILAGIDPTEDETPTPDTDQPGDETPPTATADSEPQSEPAAEPGDETPDTALTVTELAERLEMSVEDLYRDLKIDLRDGESLSLGDFKDQAKDLQRSRVLLDKAEDVRLTGENELLRKNRELQVVAQRLGRPPTAAEQAEAAQLYGQYVDRENSSAMEAIPDWSDSGVRTEDLKSISALMTEYGFSASEQGATVDHRHVKLLRDYDQLRRRLKVAGESEVRDRKNQPSGRRRKTAARKKTAQTRFHSGEISQGQAVLQAIAEGKPK